MNKLISRQREIPDITPGHGNSRANAAGKDELTQDLIYTKEELARHIDYLAAMRNGVFQVLKDLDNMEFELNCTQMHLKKTQTQLMQSSRLKALGELAAGLAHEINQPLTVIRGLSQNLLIKRDPRHPDFEKLQLIAEAAKRMEALIKHLRIFSRKDEDAPRKESFDVNVVITNAFTMLGDIRANNAIKVSMNLSDVPLIYGYPTRLEQVVINLVSNAKDAMPLGGTIEVSTRTLKADNANFVRISVADTGFGIPDDVKNRIFEPFFTSKKTGEGTGLGLSISSAIVAELRGAMTFESAPEKGTTFHVTIPAIS